MEQCINKNDLMFQHYLADKDNILIAEINYNEVDYQKLYNTQAESVKVLQTISDDFNRRYGINFKIISEDKAKDLIKRQTYLPNGFYYEPTNTAYIIAHKADRVTLIHKLGHAFLYKLKEDNIDLYNNLAKEARNVEVATKYVSLSYGQLTKEKYEQEVIMRVIDMHNENYFKSEKELGLITNILKFLKEVSDYIKSLLKLDNIDVSIIKSDTTVGEIADLLREFKGTMDLSTKNKTQNLTEDERRKLRNIIDGNVIEGTGNMAESARNHFISRYSTSRGYFENLRNLKEFLTTNPEFLYEEDSHYINNFIKRGAEAKVYMDSDMRHVIKLKDPFVFPVPFAEMLDALILHNLLFKNTAYEFLGFKRSDTNEDIYMVIRQPYIISNQEFNSDSMIKYLSYNGFISALFPGMADNIELSLRIFDLSSDNVIFKDNTIFFIDPMIKIVRDYDEIDQSKIQEQRSVENLKTVLRDKLNSNVSKLDKQQLPKKAVEIISNDNIHGNTLRDKISNYIKLISNDNYSPNTKDIVFNPYVNKDIDSFFDNFKGKLLSNNNIKQIENFNNTKGYSAIKVIKRINKDFVAIKNIEDNNSLQNIKQSILKNLYKEDNYDLGVPWYYYADYMIDDDIIIKHYDVFNKLGDNAPLYLLQNNIDERYINRVKDNFIKTLGISFRDFNSLYDLFDVVSNYNGIKINNKPVKFYKTNGKYNINNNGTKPYYIYNTSLVDDSGNAILNEDSIVIPGNYIKTIFNEYKINTKDYYIENIKESFKLSNYLLETEADEKLELISNKLNSDNQSYDIDKINNNDYFKLNLTMNDDNILRAINFEPNFLKIIEDKGLYLHTLSNSLKRSLYNLILNNELQEDLTCNI